MWNLSFPFASFLMLSNLMTAVPWTIIFLLLRHVGIYLYIIRNTDDCRRVQNRLNTRCTHRTEDNKGQGYSIGCWYIAFIDMRYEGEGEVWMIATASSFRKLVKESSLPPIKTSPDMPGDVPDAPDPPKFHTKLVIWTRCGSLMNGYYRQRDIGVTLPTPRAAQDLLLARMLHHFRGHRHTVAYIHGKTGSGKSMLGLFLADRLKGTYCNTFAPWEPGQSLHTLYTEAEPSEDCPMVIAMDEVDEALVALHHGITPHKIIPTAVRNKTGWNKMMDDIQLGMYPHILVVMTSNQNPSYIHRLDPSYLREGRTDLVLHLPPPVNHKDE